MRKEKESMDEEMLKDVKWWKQYLPKFNGTAILWLQDSMEVDQFLASDASLVGGGAVMEKQFFHWKFDAEVLQQTDNIAQKEILTIVVVVKLWAKQLAGKVVWFSTDNEISKFAINKGRTTDPFILKCLREIAWVAAEHQFLLKMVYISTHCNTLPDALS